ncbi:MAG: radical SAM protein [Deltaproteobacteria bacterium]|nr:radical SAM protein [Deltaproteobacteria bacterium]
MRYLFGPVPSRRLGYSLGVDIIPHKVCTLDCVYCQLGPTTLKTIERRAYVEPGPVLAELDEILAQKLQIDCITFSGSGEPTLNTCLGDILAGIQSRCSLPVTVLTNGTLLHMPEVRAGLLQADIVCPSFDAATLQAFTMINRPHPGVSLDLMIAGLKKFRQEFSGKIYLEVMLARRINDSPQELEAFAKVLPEFGADRIQINTVIRPAAADGVWASSPATLELARTLFGPNAEIIGGFVKERSFHEQENIGDRIVQLVGRHPSTAEDVCAALGLNADLAHEFLNQLLSQGRIFKTMHGGSTFYKA